MNVCVYDTRVKRDRPGKEQVHLASRPQMKVNRKCTHQQACSYYVHSSCLSSHTHCCVSVTERKKAGCFCSLLMAVNWLWVMYRHWLGIFLLSPSQLSVVMEKISQPSLRWSGPRHPLRWASFFSNLVRITSLLFWPQSNPPSIQQFTLCELPISFLSPLQFLPHPSV